MVKICKVLAANMMKNAIVIFCLSIILSSCTPASQATDNAKVINIYASPFVRPWLPRVYECAPAGSVIRLSSSPSGADLHLRLGEPRDLGMPAYQIDEDEMIVVVINQSSLQEMNAEQVQSLFAQGNGSAIVWGYASDADMQIVFDQLVMKERPVSSLARLAVSPDQMTDALNADPSAVGILSRAWMRDTLRAIYSFGPVPVLALMDEEPQGTTRTLISCMQN
jgi:hypothetical protein